MPDSVHIFWDNSNIFIPAKYVANRREGVFAEHNIRVQFDSLYRLARAGRPIASSMCVGSVPPELRAVWDRLRSTGVQVELYERGAASNTEQGIDQCLQVHILRAGYDHPTPGIAVLMTGDGAGYDTGAGYHADLERLATRGWGIEVLSWDIACNRRLRDWARSVGVYIPLEDYYNSVTFLEGTRRATPISLTHRPSAHPRPQP
jgi:hypothetical protein